MIDVGSLNPLSGANNYDCNAYTYCSNQYFNRTTYFAPKPACYSMKTLVKNFSPNSMTGSFFLIIRLGF